MAKLASKGPSQAAASSAGQALGLGGTTQGAVMGSGEHMSTVHGQNEGQSHVHEKSPLLGPGPVLTSGGYCHPREAGAVVHCCAAATATMTLIVWWESCVNNSLRSICCGGHRHKECHQAHSVLSTS